MFHETLPPSAVAINNRPEIIRSQIFTYKPLEDAQNGFRLVVLEPAIDPSSVIRCKLVASSLQCPCEYEALSYVWGSSKAVNPILLQYESSINPHSTREKGDQFELYITHNLEAALRALRLPDQPRILWVDSICIDQSNVKERNEQVRLMGRIYRQCQRDVLWLGSETDSIRRAMDLIKRLVTGLAHLSTFQEDDWNNIESMIGKNPVWNRIWIVQELYSAPKILLFCHGHSLEWDVIVNMVEDNEEFKDVWVNHNGSTIFRQVHKAFKNITTFHLIRHQSSVAQRIFDRSLLPVILTFGSWEATEAVDKIYGLLNIADDAQDFPVDYGKILDEVSIDFAHHIISVNKSLLILSAALGDPLQFCRQTSATVPTKTLPSWVLDISKDIPSVSGLTMCGQTSYNACGMMSVPMCGFSSDRRCLVAAGWVVDNVNHLNTVSSIVDDETSRQRWVRDVVRWAPENAMERLYVPTNETFLNAYWRTITTDRKQDKRITAEDFEGSMWFERYQSLEERTVPEEQVVLPGWRFGTSTRGIFCMLPPAAEVGDLIVVLFGGKVPYLLRPSDQGGNDYILVGEAYMHGFMDGQILFHKLVQGKFEEPIAYNII